MTYAAALREAMSLCAAAGAPIIGQSVLAGGTALRGTLDHLPDAALVEMPVCEELQLGMAIGLSLASGRPVVSCYPRASFLMRCMDQLVNHLDALPLMGYRPRVLIRVAVAHDRPLDPGPQHLTGPNFVWHLQQMLRTVLVFDLTDAAAVVPAYRAALAHGGSSMLIEHAERYDV
jgi:pyruvate/2-oxoglutarate/acetoin dehydrogenase E1 component